MFQSLKWSETLILGLVSALVGLCSLFLKEFFTSLNSRFSGKTELTKVLNQKELDYQKSLVGILEFLEKRNEFLTKQLDEQRDQSDLEFRRLRDEREKLLIELHSVREDKIRLEVRSEFRMQMVRNGETEIRSYEKVTEMSAFNLNDADAIIISDDDKRVYAASHPALHLLGYAELAEIRHRSIDEIFPSFHSVAFKAGVVGAAIMMFRGEKKAGIVGNKMIIDGIKKDGSRIKVTGVQRSWTDGTRIYYAFVMEQVPLELKAAV